jgi:ribulose 1,5-bisphosphate synthetase/thiazole synthase
MASIEQASATPAANGEAVVSPRKARQELDVIVVGAGLAGCSAARLFALEGLRVGLVESHRDVRNFMPAVCGTELIFGLDMDGPATCRR